MSNTGTTETTSRYIVWSGVGTIRVEATSVQHAVDQALAHDKFRWTKRELLIAQKVGR